MQRLLATILVLLFTAVYCFAEVAAVDTAKTPEIEAVKPLAGAPVVFRGDTLIDLFASVGPYDAKQRAANLVDRLERFAPLPGELAEVDVETGKSFSTLSVDGKRIGIIAPGDAAALGISTDELAAEFSEAIQIAYSKPRIVQIPPVTLREILYALLATSVLFFMLRILFALYPFAVRGVVRLRTTKTVGIRILNVELLSAERIGGFAYALLRIVRVVSVIVLFFVYIVIVLSQFPGTAGYATQLVHYLREPAVEIAQGIVEYIPNFFALAVVGAFLLFAVRVLRRIAMEISLDRMRLPGFYPDWAMPTFKLIRALLFLLAIVVAYPFLPGSDSPAFKAVSVFIGVLLSLGSTSAVSNMVAGIVLTYMRPYRIGDRVQIAETIGDVVEKTLLVTRLQTLKMEDVTIPNASILGHHIVNFSTKEHSEGILLHTTVTIGYDAPWRKVHELLLGAARETDGVSESPSPFVLQKALNDYSVAYELNAHTEYPSRMMELYSALHCAIQDKFNEAGIEIMSPTYAALRDGNRAAMPDDSLPPDYKAPVFRVSREE
ncbi:MAG: mechanosensitive ion channel [Calditrichaeota bacterium]|nr:mechanosensitive ion channel [Calditrichota bacterium]MCB9368113.1 mechanosensitive ion channel [Calditrichota bacterium]